MTAYRIDWMPIAKVYVVVRTWNEDTQFGLVGRSKNVMTFQRKAQAERWISERA